MLRSKYCSYRRYSNKLYMESIRWKRIYCNSYSGSNYNLYFNRC